MIGQDFMFKHLHFLINIQGLYVLGENLDVCPSSPLLLFLEIWRIGVFRDELPVTL